MSSALYLEMHAKVFRGKWHDGYSVDSGQIQVMAYVTVL